MRFLVSVSMVIVLAFATSTIVLACGSESEVLQARNEDGWAIPMRIDQCELRAAGTVSMDGVELEKFVVDPECPALHPKDASGRAATIDEPEYHLCDGVLDVQGWGNAVKDATVLKRKGRTVIYDVTVNPFHWERPEGIGAFMGCIFSVFYVVEEPDRYATLRSKRTPSVPAWAKIP